MPCWMAWKEEMAKVFGTLIELDNGEVEEHVQPKAAGTQEVGCLVVPGETNFEDQKGS